MVESNYYKIVLKICYQPYSRKKGASHVYSRVRLHIRIWALYYIRLRCQAATAHIHTQAINKYEINSEIWASEWMQSRRWHVCSAMAVASNRSRKKVVLNRMINYGDLNKQASRAHLYVWEILCYVRVCVCLCIDVMHDGLCLCSILCLDLACYTISVMVYQVKF